MTLLIKLVSFLLRRLAHVRLAFIGSVFLLIILRVFSLISVSDNKIFFLVFIVFLILGFKFSIAARIFSYLLIFSLLSWLVRFFDLSNFFATIGFLAFIAGILFELISMISTKYQIQPVAFKRDILFLTRDLVKFFQILRLRKLVGFSSIAIMVLFFFYVIFVFLNNMYPVDGFQNILFPFSLLICFVLGLSILNACMVTLDIVLKNILFFVVSITLSIFYLYYVGEYTTSRIQNPYIFKVSPTKSDTAWEEVKITGRNFKNIPFIGSVSIDNANQEVVFWSDTKIIFIVTPNYTKSGQIQVISDEYKKSNTVDFLYQQD